MTSFFQHLKFLTLGALVAFILPPFNFPPYLLFICFIPLLKYLEFANYKERFIAGAFFGLGYFVVLLKWLTVVGIDALIALSLICALWWALASALSFLFRDSKFWPIWFGISWTAVEMVRDRFPWGGFGWGQLGTVWVDTPFSGIYSLIGQIGMTCLTYILIALIFKQSRRRRDENLSRSVSQFAFVAILLFSGSYISYVFQPILISSSNSIQIAAVQGGVERTGLGVLGEPRAVLEKHISQSMQHLSRINKADLVVWPESSVDLDPFKDQTTQNLLQNLDAQIEPPLLVNGTIYKPDNLKNNLSMLIQDQQIVPIYQKQRLVPFGEFLPLREFIETYTDRASLLSIDYQPGKAPGNLEISNINLGILICFEIADDSLIHKQIADQSAVIVQTNNATYQNLGQSEQQELYTRLRAIETGRPIISIATSGISLTVDDHGNVIDRITQDEEGLLYIHVQEISGVTIATKLHLFYQMIIPFFFIGGLLAAFFKRFTIKS